MGVDGDGVDGHGWGWHGWEWIIAVELYCPEKVIIICVYIPPCVNKTATRNQMEKVVQQISNNTDKIIVVGDFNEDLIDGRDNKTVSRCFGEMGFTLPCKKWHCCANAAMHRFTYCEPVAYP